MIKLFMTFLAVSSVFSLSVVQQTNVEDALSAFEEYKNVLGPDSKLIEYSMIDDHPYTIRLCVGYKDVIIHADCSNIWRTSLWVCTENQESCDNFLDHLQVFDSKNVSISP